MVPVDLEMRMRQAPLQGYAQVARIPAAPDLYTAWKDEATCIYVGQSANLKGRITSHFSGQRGSNQFCLYVYDRFVYPQRASGLTTADVNQRTADWIRAHIAFRWVVLCQGSLHVCERQLHETCSPC